MQAPPREEFADWVAPHLTAMSRLAARMTPGDAEDVVQEALARAWRKRHTYDHTRGTPQAWLLALVADRARRTRRTRRPTPVEDLPDVPTTDRAADIDLERALRRLTDRQRLTVDLHYFLGLTTTETAAVLGCAEGTVKSTLSDARTKLRALLGDER